MNETVVGDLINSSAGRRKICGSPSLINEALKMKRCPIDGALLAEEGTEHGLTTTHTKLRCPNGHKWGITE